MNKASFALLVTVWLGACSAPRDDEPLAEPTGPGPSGSAGNGVSVPPSAGSSAGTGSEATSGSDGSGSGGAATSQGGVTAAAGSAGAVALPPAEACDLPHSKLIDVRTPAELAGALGSAKAGSMIRLAEGEIHGTFKASASGSAAEPIVLCGTRSALLSANASATVLTIEGDYWVLSGFTVTGGQKGLLLDGANHNRLTGLLVRGTGNEAVHFRSASSDNVLEWSEIRDTGSESPEFAEGVYVGSAVSQWEKFTGSASVPDRSDRNVIRNNTLGPGVKAELIDVKEGTTGGVIQDNTFDGSGIASGGFADSWVDVKGNGYMITGNHGQSSPADGFQVHVVEDGWGNDNVFRKNQASVNAKGYGFRISDSAAGTVVACDNMVSGAGAGLSNIGCQN